MRVIVLGGAGNFGSRICRALPDVPDLEVLCASRSGRGVDGHPRIGAIALNIEAQDFTAQLASLHPDVVVHCVGPFQGQDYHVVRAALAAGAHYLDLADGRDFVARFAATNDAAAQACRRLAITGASTLPAMSSAVLDELAKGFSSLTSIEIAIAPGQRAVRGAATIGAVFSYLGLPFRWLRNGQWQPAIGWQELKRLQFAFGSRWAAACDVPDLELLPQRFPSVRSVEFRAALEFAIEHWGLWSLAMLRRLGMPMNVQRWSVGLERIASWLEPLGGEHGGMLVSVVGIDSSGKARRLTWHITAPASDGPQIPCMPSILLVRKLAAGALPGQGAHACMGFLTLADFEPEFARWEMRTQILEGRP